jgi:predicted unusual protein kinase regulating ubiquinone biosynthesis (AarF/ABC1/UbiB family)
MIGWSQKDMAKASITEVLNQLLMYMDAPGGVVILDIDPHEENQLAEHRLIGTKKTMVNIDLGQSVLIEPEVVRGLVKAILLVATKRTAEAFQVLEKYVNFQNDEQRKIFWEIFYANQSKYKDPVEALTQTLEKVELKGIMLKPEFLYFQKLFATLVGLKRHINDEYYIIKQVSKLFALRLLGSPIEVKNELVELLKKTPQDEKNLAITRETKQNLSLPAVIMCKDLSF